MVDAFDNAANGRMQQQQQQNQQNQQQEQYQSANQATNVPPLHRSDGGLGGIGRASEVQRRRSNDVRTMGTDGFGRMMSEEESSLTVAREFLSRLVSSSRSMVFAKKFFRLRLLDVLFMFHSHVLSNCRHAISQSTKSLWGESCYCWHAL